MAASPDDPGPDDPKPAPEASQQAPAAPEPLDRGCADPDDDWEEAGFDGEPAHDELPFGDEPQLGHVQGDDRLAMIERPVPMLRRAGSVLPIMVASLVAHIALFVLFLVVAKEPDPIAAQQETPVEIVQEPAPAPDLKKQEAQATPPPNPEEAKPEEAKPDKPKENVTKEDATKQEVSKPEVSRPEVSKQDGPKPDKPDVAKPEPQEPGARKSEPPQASAADPASDPTTPDETAKTLQSLQAELAALKSQQADLQAEAAAKAAPSAALGPLPDSFRAVALPADAIGGEDSVSYQETVFSQLAKAKKAERRVVTPGVAQVVFDVGDRGDLIGVSLAQSSGNAYLDGEAVAIVRRAAPFPPPPQGALRHFSAAMRLDAQD